MDQKKHSQSILPLIEIQFDNFKGGFSRTIYDGGYGTILNITDKNVKRCQEGGNNCISGSNCARCGIIKQ
jgi:hypothetical protein